MWFKHRYNVENAGHISAEIANIFLKWQTGYLKLNGTESAQVLVLSPFYPFAILVKKKKVREEGNKVTSGLIGAHFLPLAVRRNTSIHRKTT